MADVKLSYSGDKIDELLRKAEIYEAEIKGGEIKLKVSDMKIGYVYGTPNNAPLGYNTANSFCCIGFPIWLNKGALFSYNNTKNIDCIIRYHYFDNSSPDK